MLCRLQRLRDVVKSSEQVSESAQSLRRWLLDADESLVSHIVYHSADDDEIQKHLAEQQVASAADDDYDRDLFWMYPNF